MIQILLQDKISKLGLSNREAARQIGIAHTTLNRILEGGDFDLNTLVMISTWLSVNPATLLGTLSPSDDQMLSQLTTLLSTSPALADVFLKAAHRVAEKTMSPDTFRDLTAYAAFRMGLNGGETTIEQQHTDEDIKH
jgi:transcriptional regulator with XRE-family HTH domain